MAEILQGKKFYGEHNRIIKCAFCGGSGRQPHSTFSRCAACRGKGEAEFKGPVIKCPSCQGRGKALGSAILSCICCRGAGAIEKDKKAGENTAGILRERLREIIKKLKQTREKTKKKAKEIKERLKPAKPFIKEIKKETLWFENLGNKIKKGWKSLWEQ